MTLATGQDYPSSVGVYQGTVYWTNERAATVMKLPSTGGPVETQASPDVGGGPNTATAVGPLAVLPPNVYWWATSTASVDSPEGPSGPGDMWPMMAPLSGGPATQAPGVGTGGSGTQVGGIAGIAEATFWAASGAGLIFFGEGTASSSGGGEFVSGKSPFGLAADSDTLYWTDSAAGVVLQTPIESMTFTPPFDSGISIPPVGPDLQPGTNVTLASAQGSPAWIAIDDASVYWTNMDAGTVMKAAKGGGSLVTLASGQSTPYGIAVSGGTVYWTNQGGSVMSAPSAGGAPTTLATGQSTPYGLAVEGTNVYWTTYNASGQVLRLTPGCSCP